MVRGFRHRQPGAPVRDHPKPGPSPWLIGAAALIVAGLVLGFIGFERMDGSKNDAFDNFYATMRLLVLDLEVRHDPPNKWVEVGRWFAAIGAALATWRGLRYVLSDEIERWKAGRRDGHVVVAGLGDYGTHLALAFQAAKRPSDRLPVTGIEREEGSRGAGSLRAAGGLVLTGDAADPRQRLLEEAQVARARYLVVTSGDDGRNVDIAMRAAELIGDRRVPLTAFVHLDDLRLWPRLKARMVSSRGERPFRIEFFNVFECGARILLQTHRPFPREAAGPVGQILLLGLGGLGEQVLVHIAKRWEIERGDRVGRVPVTVLAPDATRRVATLLEHQPRLKDVAAIDTVDSDLDLTRVESERLFEEVPAAIAYVCAECDADGVSAALGLHAAARARGVPVVVVLDQEDRGLAATLRKDGRSLPGLSIFGLVSRALPPDLLVRGTNEILARAKHEHYLAMEHARGEDTESNPSATAWDELPESLKESNRAFADRIGEKLERARCVLVPDAFAFGREPLFEFEADEIEDLARKEHDRWRDDLEDDGWTYGEIKDPGRRRHPLLVDWEKVPEAEREKDREPVRALPEFVARAGFAIVRAEPPERPLVLNAVGE